MSLFKLFDLAGQGMNAQSVRMNTTASNLANVNSVASSINETYKSRQPVFETQLQYTFNDTLPDTLGVKVSGITESQKPPQMRYEPYHPMADASGYIYLPNVNAIEEMTNMISASRAYQTNALVANQAKSMIEQTLKIGQ